jgi:hypothetical protein
MGPTKGHQKQQIPFSGWLPYFSPDSSEADEIMDTKCLKMGRAYLERLKCQGTDLSLITPYLVQIAASNRVGDW